MSLENGRYQPSGPLRVAAGWSVERLTPPSRLFGANGLRTGADGRIYVAQVAGSQISAIDIDTGQIETISAMGSDIVAPDDLVFDEQGNLYLTEITEDRVSMLAPNGTSRVICGDMVGAPVGVTPTLLRGVGSFAGPMGPFADIAAGADGTLYLSADAEGSVLALHPA